MDNWFTIDKIDENTYIISEYRHWEETHCYLLNGNTRSLLIDTGLGISNIYEEVLKLTDKPIMAVIKIDGKIIATGCFVDNHITRVYVLPEQQKMGYGTFIIKNIVAQISENYDKAYLDASLPAAALYGKLGFSITKHEHYPVENGVILAYEVMEKELHIDAADEFEYKRATIENIDELVRTRIIVLRAANRLLDDVDMSIVEQESYAYYKRALESGEHIAYLVYDNEKFIGAGGVSFYQVMPTYHNPTGKKAYIMNMYTAPEYRRRGIVFRTLDLLIKDAKELGVLQIALEATDMGRPLYEKYGFVKMEDEMEL